MEADELLCQELFRGLDHQELINVLLLLVKGRVGLDGTLVVAFWVGASVAVGQADSFLATNSCCLQQVGWQLFEEERLELDQYGLHCVS
jgi:hypothetical protein